jgi:hypothetical protein
MAYRGVIPGHFPTKDLKRSRVIEVGGGRIIFSA